MAEILKSQILDYLNYCERVRGMSETTINMKHNVLKRFYKIMRSYNIDSLEQVDNIVYNKWIVSENRRKISPRSLNEYNAIVFAMIRYSRETGILVPLKISLIGKLKEGQIRRTFYTKEEIGRAILVAKESGDDATALMIKIMFETGMRIAEVTHLRLCNFTDRRITFIGKGRKPREVYICEQTLAELLDYIGRHQVSDYLWARAFFSAETLEATNPPMGTHEVTDLSAKTPKTTNFLTTRPRTTNCPPEQNPALSGPPTTMTVRKYLRRAFEAAGFSNFYPHALRHSFATDLQLRGASVAEIKEMIGHESITTTERYLHGFDGRLEELFDKYR